MSYLRNLTLVTMLLAASFGVQPIVSFSLKSLMESFSSKFFSSTSGAIYKDCGKIKIKKSCPAYKLQNKMCLIFLIKGSVTGAITDVNITDCIVLPCVFKRGNNYTLDLSFNSSK